MSRKLHIALVLDKSSSMAGTRDYTISGFNEQVAQIELNAKDSPVETTVTLITFNGEVFEHLLMAPVDQLEEADPSFYQCEGMTAMRDAIGYAVRKLKEAAGPEDDVLVTTISDGDENASTHYTAEALKEEIDGLQATKRWTFSYMGCTASSLQRVSQTTGIPVSNMAAWSNHSAGAAKRGMTHTAAAVGKYLRSKAANPDEVLVEHLYTDSNDQYMDFAGSANGAAVNLADAVAAEGQHVNSGARGFAARPAGARGLMRTMAVNRGGLSGMVDDSQAVGAVAPAAPVVDRPEDLELRVGKSDVFGKGNKASW